MEYRKATLLREVFGESSDEENDHEDYSNVDYSLTLEPPIEHSDELNPNWTQISDVPGLWICHDFISAEEQASLVSEIEKGIDAVFYLPSVEFELILEDGRKHCNDSKACFLFLNCFGCRRMVSGNFR